MSNPKHGVALVESDRTIAVHRHGCLISSWPKRAWEVSRVLDDATLWAYHERTGAEKRELRAWLRGAMQGPPEGLTKRLIEQAPASQDADRVPVLPPDERGQKPKWYNGYVTKPSSVPRRVGRPYFIPAYPDAPSVSELAGIEFLTGDITHRGMSLVAADTEHMFGAAATAKQLNLTGTQVGELVEDYYHPEPPLPFDATRRLIGDFDYRPLELSDQMAAPPIARANALFLLGRTDEVISKRTGLTDVRLRHLRVPRHPSGTCTTCATYYAKQPTPLHIHFCAHYGQAFRYEQGHVERLAMSLDEYLAALRSVAPATTKPPIEAWKNNSWARRSVARWLYRAAGPRTLEHHFGDSMVQAGGRQSAFLHDYAKAWGNTPWTRN